MKHEERMERIKPLLTPEFLAALAETAKSYGWTGDYMEVGTFVEEMYRIAGVTPPDLEPYTYDDE